MAENQNEKNNNYEQIIEAILFAAGRVVTEQELMIALEVSQEKIEKSFLLELERTVSPDSVIKIDNIEYEVDYHYQSQKVLLRYSPDLSKVYVVDKSDDSLKEIKLLDKKSNSGVKREKISLSELSQ